MESASRLLYTLLIVLVAFERLVELALTTRNAKRAFARGAVEVGRGQYPWMVLLHTSFLVACPLEVWLLRRPFVPALAVGMGLVLVVTMTTRHWVIATLGERWNTRVICIPGLPRVRRGPYRFLRHPNYVAVVLELIALPMIHTAWWTALAFGVLNGFWLRARIRVENEALNRLAP